MKIVYFACLFSFLSGCFAGYVHLQIGYDSPSLHYFLGVVGGTITTVMVYAAAKEDAKSV